MFFFTVILISAWWKNWFVYLQGTHATKFYQQPGIFELPDASYFEWYLQIPLIDCIYQAIDIIWLPNTQEGVDSVIYLLSSTAAPSKLGTYNPSESLTAKFYMRLLIYRYM